jgi:hypothetical protein
MKIPWWGRGYEGAKSPRNTVVATTSALLSDSSQVAYWPNYSSVIIVQIRAERIQILPWDVKAKKVKQQEIDRNRRNLIDLINY